MWRTSSLAMKLCMKLMKVGESLIMKKMLVDDCCCEDLPQV